MLQFELAEVHSEGAVIINIFTVHMSIKEVSRIFATVEEKLSAKVDVKCRSEWPVVEGADGWHFHKVTVTSDGESRTLKSSKCVCIWRNSVLFRLWVQVRFERRW